MAKVFRKVRQKLMAESKIKKYLAYAIGEIILVVIGILIALQINAANQNRQRAKLEKVLLNQVRFELLEIYEDIWRDAENLAIGDISHDRIYKYIIEDKPYHPSLCFDFYWMKRDEYIYPANAAFSRLQEEGLDIIKNDTLRIALQALYEGHFPRLTKHNAYTPDISTVLNEYYLEAFRPNTDLSIEFNYQLENDTVGQRAYADVHYHYPKTDSVQMKRYTVGYVPLNFAVLKEDSKFLMLLEQTKRYRGNKILRYSFARYTIKEVINIIERNLG